MVFARFKVKASIGAEGSFGLDAAVFLALSWATALTTGAEAPSDVDSATCLAWAYVRSEAQVSLGAEGK
jgi:hypothetical protein